MPEEIIKKDVNACIKCGTRGIIVHDCGYTTFNPGWAKCIKCGKKAEESICGDPPIKSIKAKWNAVNPKPKIVIARIDEKIKRLREEKKRIKKLFEL